MKKVVIIGAGISGLAAGWYHKQKGSAVTILERTERVGGWIRTTQVDGFLFEEGPRGFRPTGKGRRTLDLVKEIGLENQLVAADKGAKRRYLAKNGQLERFSLGFLLRNGLIGAVIRGWRPPSTTEEDETIAAYCTRRFNAKITHNLVDPLVKGIFGGSAEELSMRSCFPGIWESKNLKREKSEVSLYSFRGGMEQLTQRLGELLQENIVLNSPVDNIDALEGDLIIGAAPAYGLANHHPFTYKTLTTINLGWRGDLLAKRGYGFLIPSQERERIMGMTWDSEIFPQHNQGAQTRICVMIEGEGRLEMALEGVKKYLGIDKIPDATLIGYPKLPQYLYGHHRRLAFFQKNHPLELIGNTYTGVGVNDCIEAAWKSASS